jgi:hypothetical protein
MRREYTKYRTAILKTARLIFKAQDLVIPDNIPSKELDELVDQHIDDRRKSLTTHLLQRRKNDVLINGKINRLIRAKMIDSNMASSLMNDSAITASIIKHLIRAAELLYLNKEVLLAVATKDSADPKVAENSQ